MGRGADADLSTPKQQEDGGEERWAEKDSEEPPCVCRLPSYSHMTPIAHKNKKKTHAGQGRAHLPHPAREGADGRGIGLWNVRPMGSFGNNHFYVFVHLLRPRRVQRPADLVPHGGAYAPTRTHAPTTSQT